LRRLGVWNDEGIWDQAPARERAIFQSAEQNPRALAELLDRRRTDAQFRVQVEEHVAQLCFRDHVWRLPRRNQNIYEQWVLFDDLWASAHADLANSILRYVQRWDVLSTSRTGSDNDA